MTSNDTPAATGGAAAVADSAGPACCRRLPASLRGFLVLLLFMAGVQLWLIRGDAQWPENRQLILTGIAVIAAMALLAFPATRRLLVGDGRETSESPAKPALLDRVRFPSGVMRGAIFILLAAGSGYYLYATARSQGRSFTPIIHDEHAYLIQAQMLARGRLWMPAHPVAQSFESFHLITDRVYAAKYSPGAAMFYAPAILVHRPHWLTPLLLVALSVGLFYLVLTEMIDGLAGLMGTMMLPAMALLRRVSIDAISQAPMLFLALLALWAVLHWRKRRSLGWIVLAGVAIGWGAITRPVDALSLAIPLGLLVVFDLRHIERRRWIPTLAAGAIAMLPFVAIQLIYNKGVTGSLTTLPWNYYATHDDPYDTLGSKPLALARPEGITLVQKRRFSEEFTRAHFQIKLSMPFRKRLIDLRLDPTLAMALPSLLLMAFIPPALLGLWRRSRWVLVGMLAIFLLLYTPYTFFILHYAVVAAIGVILLVLVGWNALAENLPRAGGSIRVIGAAAILGFSIAALPQLQKEPDPDEWDLPPQLAQVNQRLAELPHQPALVLFRFDPIKGDPHCENVYNIDVAWPDDARVIRAHDLGDAGNRPLFEYYAARSPDRHVYLYDLSRHGTPEAIEDRGTVREQAAKK